MSIITDEKTWENFPNISREEIKLGVSEELEGLIPTLRSVFIVSAMATNEFYINECYVDLRERRAGKDEKLTSALCVTGYAVQKSLAISIACLYDGNGTNILQIQNVFIKNSKDVVERNKNQIILDEILKLKKKFEGKKLNSAIEKLRKFRGQALAHIDQNPAPPAALPTFGELEDLLLHALKMSILCMHFVSKITVDIRKIVKQAEEKRDVLNEMILNN